MNLFIYIVLGFLSLSNWGSNGHRVVAEIASFYLTSNASNKINDILKGETIVYSSMYADDIKSDSRFSEYYDWHFINMELDQNYEDIIPSEKVDVCIAINRCIDILESSFETQGTDGNVGAE